MALNGVIPVPVAMKSVFSFLPWKVNLPLGPRNSILSPMFKLPSQLLPRPPSTIFRHVLKQFASSLGQVQMEYARKHGGTLSAIFMVTNWPASNENGSAVAKLSSVTSEVNFCFAEVVATFRGIKVG